MNTAILNIFLPGIRTGFSQWRIALVTYLFQLLLAVTLGIQVYQVLEASIGRSLELDKLLGNYDHTVIMDLLNVHGASISPLLGQLRWLVLTYIIFSIFINGGILYAVVKGEKTWVTFWKGGALFFFRFMKLGIFFLTLFLLLSAALWVPFAGFFFQSPEYLSSEKISVWLLVIALVLYLFILLFLFGWSVNARLEIMANDSRVWPAIKGGFTFTLRRYAAMTGLTGGFLLLHVLLLFLYWTINDSGVASPGWILFFLLVQQAVAYLRVMIRVMTYASLKNFYLQDR